MLLLRGLVIAHALALLAILFSPIDFPVKLILCLLPVLSAGLCYQLYGNNKCRWFINRVCVTENDDWTIRLADQKERRVRLSGYYRHPRLLILNFSMPAFRRRSVVLLSDSADPDLIRRLRVRLGSISGDNDDDGFAR